MSVLRALVLIAASMTTWPIAAQAPTPREPSIDEVVQRTRRAARALGPARVEAMVRRARLRGLVPQLRINAERGLQQDRSSSNGRASDRTNEAVGDDLSVGATLTFELGRLVFAPDEVRILSIERWLASDLRKLVAEVVRVYFARLSLVRELHAGKGDDPELRASIAEHEALLDAYTDGGFTAARAGARQR
ncbi:MAG: hypothetical protein ABW252_16745 [Polyangiales bacterium]